MPGAGRYSYKFLVNGTHWIQDPANGLVGPDHYGGFNSVLEVS